MLLYTKVEAYSVGILQWMQMATRREPEDSIPEL